MGQYLQGKTSIKWRHFDLEYINSTVYLVHGGCFTSLLVAPDDIDMSLGTGTYAIPIFQGA